MIPPKNYLTGNSGSFQKLGNADKNWKAALIGL